MPSIAISPIISIMANRWPSRQSSRDAILLSWRPRNVPRNREARRSCSGAKSPTRPSTLILADVVQNWYNRGGNIPFLTVRVGWQNAPPVVVRSPTRNVTSLHQQRILCNASSLCRAARHSSCSTGLRDRVSLPRRCHSIPCESYALSRYRSAAYFSRHYARLSPRRSAPQAYVRAFPPSYDTARSSNPSSLFVGVGGRSARTSPAGGWAPISRLSRHPP